MRLLARALLLLTLTSACASHEAEPPTSAAGSAGATAGSAGSPGGGNAGTTAGSVGQPSGGAGQSAGGASVGGAGQAGAAGSVVPAEATVRYLSLGDSFTIGTGTTPDKSFPARLVARWQAAGGSATLQNPAVNGYTSQRILETEVPLLTSFAPTFVTLAAGANDIVQGRSEDAYRASLQSIVQAVLKAGVVPARLVAIPQPDWPASPVGMSFGDVATLRARIASLNAILRDEVQAVGGRYIDLTSLMQTQASQKMFAPDGLHPSAEAYDAWAAALFEALPDLHP